MLYALDMCKKVQRRIVGISLLICVFSVYELIDIHSAVLTTVCENYTNKHEFLLYALVFIGGL